MINKVHIIGPVDLDAESPMPGAEKPKYHVEFPAESEASGDPDNSSIGLSPVSAMSLSLSSFHLKRPLEVDPDTCGNKRQ